MNYNDRVESLMNIDFRDVLARTNLIKGFLSFHGKE